MAIPVGTAVGYLDLDYSKFSKKLDTAISEANGLSMKLSDTLGSGLTTVGNKIAGLGTALTTGITVPLGLATGSAIKFGAEFDKGMSNVKAVSGATAEEFEMMRDAAIDWGEKTVYTATEASDALYYMGLAGWNANDSVAALGPVLNLAAAGNLELGRTSDIVTDAMTALQIEADGYTNGIANAEHFTNALASAMSNSNTDVDQLGEAFKYVAPVAGSLGYSIEDLSLALGTMANVGVKGSQAGTGLRQALKNLITPANDAAAALMDELGVSLFDSEGKALSFKEVMDNLRTTFGGVDVDIEKMSDVLENEGEDALLNYVDGLNLTMTQQEKLQDIVQIFGTRALPGVLGIINASEEKYNDLANAIYSSDEAFVKHGDDIMTYKEAVEQYGEELINTSDEFEVLGAAAGMAEVQMDNLQGDWIRFTSALGTSKIEILDLVNGALRNFVQKLTDLVKWFNDLGDEQQKNILKWAAIIASIGPVLLVFGKLITGIGNTITAISAIGGAMTKLKIGFGMFRSNLAAVSNAARLARTGLAGLGAEISPLGAAFGTVTSLPFIAAVAAIVALIAAFKHLMKTNDEFREKIIGIWDGIKAKFDEAGQKILDVINKLGFDFESLSEAMKAAFDWFANAIAPIFLGVFETISTVIGSIINIVTGLFEIIGGLIIGFRDGDWSTFTQGIVDFFGGIFDIIATPFILVFNVITEYLTAFGTSWNEIWQGVFNFFEKIGTGIVETVTSFVKGVIERWNNLKTDITVVVTVLKALLEYYWDKIKENILFVVEVIYNNVYTIWDNLKQGLIIIVTVLRDTIVGVWNFIKNSIISVVTVLRDTINNIWQAIKDFIVTTVTGLKDTVISLFEILKATVINIITNVKDTLINTFTTLKESLVTKVTEIKEGIVNVFNGIKEKFAEIGNNIVQGIWNGISSGWAWLTSKVTEVATSLLTAAKTALGIKSPSRAFRYGVGKWIPPGIVEGVEDAMPKAIDEIQSVFDKGLSQISGEVEIGNPLFGLVDTIKTVLNETTIWFESIEERLYAIVDNMKTDLMNLIELGQVTINSDGTLSGLVYEKPSNSIKSINGTDNEQKGDVINNFYYTFNSPKAIDEIEASRKIKETQRDLSEGF